jgi:hypothetical protein
MGKIVASYLVKVHVHEDDPVEAPADGSEPVANVDAPARGDVKEAIIAGLAKELGLEVTVSHIERTDAD